MNNVNVFGDSWLVPGYEIAHPECVDCSGEEEPDTCTGLQLQAVEAACYRLFHKHGPFKVST